MAVKKDGTPDSRATMAKKALKTGVKSALKTFEAGGLVGSAASGMKKEAKRTRKASE